MKMLVTQFGVNRFWYTATTTNDSRGPDLAKANEKDRAIVPSEEEILKHLLGFNRSTPMPTTRHTLDLTKNVFNKIGWVDQRMLRQKRHNMYAEDMHKLLNDNSIHGSVPVVFGDMVEKGSYLVGSKSRAKGGLQTLLPLNTDRHSEMATAIVNGKIPELPYDEKSDVLIWRGSATGTRPRYTDLPRCGRLKFVRMYENQDWCDIGLVFNSGCKQDVTGVSYKREIHISKWLNHKVLLAVEGNDVPSSLRWMMQANSVVLMAPPTCETNFCETLLRPWVHYVPLKEDMTDLREKHEWILRNPEHAKQIIQASQEWSRAFCARKLQERGNRCIVSLYQKIRSVL